MVFAPGNVRGARLIVAILVSGKGPTSFDAGRAAQNMLLAAWDRASAAARTGCPTATQPARSSEHGRARARRSSSRSATRRASETRRGAAPRSGAPEPAAARSRSSSTACSSRRSALVFHAHKLPPPDFRPQPFFCGWEAHVPVEHMGSSGGGLGCPHELGRGCARRQGGGGDVGARQRLAGARDDARGGAAGLCTRPHDRAGRHAQRPRDMPRRARLRARGLGVRVRLQLARRGHGRRRVLDRVPRTVAGGDELLAVAQERSLEGRNGVYDVDVTRADGAVVAAFRGRSAATRATVLGDAAP